jgi:ESCRT-II complex subunit VPS36
MVQEREVEMNVAFGDMESLMLKAKDMVKLAAELNEKLTAITANSNNLSSSSLASSGEEPEEATFIRSSLSQLGLQMSNVAVTIDMMKDERVWLEELAKELGKVLQGALNANREGTPRGMMKDKGIIALDEVWGGWNRARGVGPFFHFFFTLTQV